MTDEVEVIVIEVEDKNYDAFEMLKPLRRLGGTKNFMVRALIIQKLIKEYGHSQVSIAKRVGCSQATISYHLTIAEKLVPELQEVGLKKEMVYTAARIIAEMPEEEQRKFLEMERGRGGKITVPMVKGHKTKMLSAAIEDLPDIPDDAPDGLYLPYDQMQVLLETGELAVDWNGQQFTLGYDCL